jgi:hypothetical protein
VARASGARGLPGYGTTAHWARLRRSASFPVGCASRSIRGPETSSSGSPGRGGRGCGVSARLPRPGSGRSIRPRGAAGVSPLLSLHLPPYRAPTPLLLTTTPPPCPPSPIVPRSSKKTLDPLFLHTEARGHSHSCQLLSRSIRPPLRLPIGPYCRLPLTMARRLSRSSRPFPGTGTGTGTGTATLLHSVFVIPRH